MKTPQVQHGFSLLGHGQKPSETLQLNTSSEVQLPLFLASPKANQPTSTSWILHP